MRNHLPLILLFFCLFVTLPLSGIAQTPSNILKFRTGKGWDIVVEKGSILLNNKELYRFKYDGIIYDSKRNRLIEDGGSVFLFLEIDGRPNRDLLYAFNVAEHKIELLAEAISSDVKDIDGDSYLEFGGRDLNEVHPSEDSMYYVPFHYYEIRKGRILYDSALTKKKSIQENGIYLVYPLDLESGFCCKVIVKPGLKKVRLVDPLIISERIDGPANIRETVKGRQLWVLNDNTPVSTSDAMSGWYRIGLTVDLTEAQFAAHKVVKGSTLFVSGLMVGKALDDLSVDEVYKEKGRGKGVLTGYTTMQNIKAPTLPENVLAKLIDQNAVDNIGMARLKDFIRGFGFSKGQIGPYVKYQLDEGVVSGPSSPLRLALVFNKEELFAVVHRRTLPLKDPSVHRLNRDYFLSVIASPSVEYTEAFIKEFNAWIKKAG